VLSNSIKFKLKSFNGLNGLIPLAYGYKTDILIDIYNTVILAWNYWINISDKIYLGTKLLLLSIECDFII